MSTATPEIPNSFEELGLAPELLQAVSTAGYQHPTPIQARTIPLILRGRDVIGLAQTGTGKTAAVTLPIVHRLLGGPRRVRALVLVPTRELAAQVTQNFATYAAFTELRVTDVYGG
ncbi:MAG: DEAD/DEAH box helicase, partial [Gemmatimonadaceae bacterium]